MPRAVHLKDSVVEITDEQLSVLKRTCELVSEIAEHDDSSPIVLSEVEESCFHWIVQFVERFHDRVLVSKDKVVSNNLGDHVDADAARFVDETFDRAESKRRTAQAVYLMCDAIVKVMAFKYATLIYNRTPSQIRREFGLPEPAPEEEEEICKKHAWIFESRV